MKKIISSVLIISILFCFLTLSFPVNAAVLVDDIIYGSIIVAFLAACGISFTSNGSIGQSLAQYFYNKFNDFSDTPIGQLQSLIDIGFENGIISLNQALTNKLIDFKHFFVNSLSDNQYIFTGKDINIEGISYPCPTYDSILTNKVLPYHLQINQDYNIYLNNTEFTIRYDVQQGNNHHVYINNRAYPIAGSAIQTYDNIGFCFCIYNNYLTICCTYTNQYGSTNPTIIIGVIAFNELGEPNNTIINTANNIDIPISDTGININTNNVNVSDITELSKDIVGNIDTNTIESTFITKPIEPIEPIPPNTNQTWIKSFHSIWNYVDYFVNQTGEFFNFIGQILSSMPQTISWCFYGAFVLILFAGIISRLLL